MALQPLGRKDLVPTPDVVDGELISDDEYRRRIDVAGVWRRLPARWQDRDERSRTFGAAGRFLILVPVRYPQAMLRGTGKAGQAWWRWIRVQDFYDAAKQSQQLAHRFDEIQRHRARRMVWTLGTVATTGVGLVVADLTAGPVVVWVVGVALSGGLALAGRRQDGAGRTPLLRPRSISWAMDGNNLVTAFRDAKLIGKDDGLAFVRAPRRDGAGWAVVLDLPPSRKASDVVKNREALASALAVDEVQLIAERVRGKGGHAGRVSLWVADDDPFAADPIRSPLADADSWDLWQAPPFGTTARGALVTLPLVWTSLLIGAIPRMGKTYVMRLPLTAAALDPYVRLIVADGKGGRDHRPFELVAHRFIPNARAESIVRLIAVLEEVAADVEDRFGRIAEMDDDTCPESKLTPQISRNPDFDMPLTVIGIDEIQNFLEDETPLDPDQPKGKKRGQRILELLTFIAKTGPAAGFMLVLATQKPDSAVIPDKLRGQIGTRFALRVMTWQASETILGAGTYKGGMDASKLLKGHKGVGLLLGADGETDLEAGEAVTVRSHLLQIKEIRAACQRGRAAREAAGTLTGDAAGHRDIDGLPDDVAQRIEQETSATTTSTAPEDIVDAEIVELPPVLAELCDVIEDHETGVVATADLADRIGGEWDAKTLGEALRRAGVPAPTPPRQRVNGSPHPVSVTSIDAIKATVNSFYGDE